LFFFFLGNRAKARGEFFIFFTELINMCKQKTNELHELL